MISHSPVMLQRKFLQSFSPVFSHGVVHRYRGRRSSIDRCRALKVDVGGTDASMKTDIPGSMLPAATSAAKLNAELATVATATAANAEVAASASHGGEHAAAVHVDGVHHTAAARDGDHVGGPLPDAGAAAPAAACASAAASASERKRGPAQEALTATCGCVCPALCAATLCVIWPAP